MRAHGGLEKGSQGSQGGDGASRRCGRHGEEYYEHCGEMASILDTFRTHFLFAAAASLAESSLQLKSYK